MRAPLLLSAGLLLAAPLSGPAGEDAKPIAGIGPAGKIVKLHTGFKFTEGPAVDRDGNVYFNDIPEQKTYKVDTKGKLSLFRENNGRANGMMIGAGGQIVTCEMEGRVVAVDPQTKKVSVVADKHEGKPFNAPNDLVLTNAGTVYFTDPTFGAAKPLPQGKAAVYYGFATGDAVRLIDDLPNPNGILLSPDEKTLYVFPSGQPQMMAYPVDEQNRFKLGKGKVFCTLKQPEKKGFPGADGATVDVKGNLYITSALGLQVYNPAGELLGIIAIPEQPANVCFGGPDMRTLYVTARTSLYTVPMEIAGHRFPGGR